VSFPSTHIHWPAPQPDSVAHEVPGAPPVLMPPHPPQPLSEEAPLQYVELAPLQT
jgi:hypothetical protein